MGSVSALALECELYLSGGCLISIFHHVKQIEDNEGLGDEGQTCAQHTKRSICFQWDTEAVVREPLIGYALEIDGVPLLSD